MLIEFPHRFVTTKELSEMIPIPEGTLRQWRCSRVGPKWYKVRGRVFYDLNEVEEYLHESQRGPSVRAHIGERNGSFSKGR